MVALQKDITLRPYRQGDIEQLDNLITNSEIYPVANSDAAFTLTLNGRPAMVGGFIVYWNGVAEAWLYSSQAAKPIALSAVRRISKLIEEFATDHNLHRLQCTVACNFYQGLRLAKALGFTPEAVLRRYLYDKTDCLMFARFFDVDGKTA